MEGPQALSMSPILVVIFPHVSLWEMTQHAARVCKKWALVVRAIMRDDGRVVAMGRRDFGIVPNIVMMIASEIRILMHATGLIKWHVLEGGHYHAIMVKALPAPCMLRRIDTVLQRYLGEAISKTPMCIRAVRPRDQLLKQITAHVANDEACDHTFDLYIAVSHISEGYRMQDPTRYENRHRSENTIWWLSVMDALFNLAGMDTLRSGCGPLQPLYIIYRHMADTLSTYGVGPIHWAPHVQRVLDTGPAREEAREQARAQKRRKDSAVQRGYI